MINGFSRLDEVPTQIWQRVGNSGYGMLTLKGG